MLQSLSCDSASGAGGPMRSQRTVDRSGVIGHRREAVEALRFEADSRYTLPTHVARIDRRVLPVVYRIQKST